MHSPKISVIVPVYNAEKYLRRCIDSILAQTYKDFELLLIDDGSKDSSGAICDEYASKDSRVRVFHKQNGGVSSARNLGLKIACGEFVTFCDSDDYVEVDYLRYIFTDCEYDMSGVSMKAISSEIFWTLPDLSSNGNKNIINSILGVYDDGFRRVIGKLFKLRIIRANDISFETDIKWGEDSLFVLDFLKCCNSIRFLSTALYNYNLSENGLTQSRSYQDEIRLLDEFVNRVWRFDIDDFEKYLLARKFGYYHFECILKTYVFNNRNLRLKKERLSWLKDKESVNIIISSKIKNKGYRTRIFDLFLSKGFVYVSIAYAKFLDLLGKPLY